MTSSNGNIFPVTGHLCGEFTGQRWIPRTKASDMELWFFLWIALNKPRLVIWDAIAPIMTWRHCNDTRLTQASRVRRYNNTGHHHPSIALYRMSAVIIDVLAYLGNRPASGACYKAYRKVKRIPSRCQRCLSRIVPHSAETLLVKGTVIFMWTIFVGWRHCLNVSRFQ